MTVVTNYLVQLISKQVDGKGPVVWYYPEQAYAAAVSELTASSERIGEVVAVHNTHLRSMCRTIGGIDA